MGLSGSNVCKLQLGFYRHSSTGLIDETFEIPMGVPSKLLLTNASQRLIRRL